MTFTLNRIGINPLLPNPLLTTLSQWLLNLLSNQGRAALCQTKAGLLRSSSCLGLTEGVKKH